MTGETSRSSPRCLQKDKELSSNLSKLLLKAAETEVGGAVRRLITASLVALYPPGMPPLADGSVARPSEDLVSQICYFLSAEGDAHLLQLR